MNCAAMFNSMYEIEWESTTIAQGCLIRPARRYPCRPLEGFPIFAPVMRSVLFVCTGNYYRSRISEILFNHLAIGAKIPVRAFSRGFRLNPVKNKGVISPHAIPFLSSLNITPREVGEPTPLSEPDLTQAHKVIVLDEKEHRPMMTFYFPDWENKVEYWSFEDDYIVSPGEMLPSLKAQVEALVYHYSEQQNS
jgi:protein-tyrosine phosphatase